MSISGDSDDTDLLLLIPPNLFLIESEDEFGDSLVSTEVVSELCDQVQELRERVSAIEESSRIGSPGLRVESWNCFGGSELEEMTSPGKPVDLSLSTPSRRMDLPEVERLLKKIEDTQQEMEAKLSAREREYNIGGKSERQERVSQLGDNIGSVPDLGFGIRGLFASESPSKSLRPTDKPVSEDPCVKKHAYLTGSPGDNEHSKPFFPLNDTSPSSRLPSPLSSERRKLKLLSARRRLNLGDSPRARSSRSDVLTVHNDGSSREDFGLGNLQIGDGGARGQAGSQTESALGYAPSSKTNFAPFSKYGENLMSLNDLWSEEEEAALTNPLKIKQKLEEEKYRRMHLEQQVQLLQRRVLEGEEKLAVAMQVDEKKDKAIDKLTGAWKQMVNHWKILEDQRHAVAQQLAAEKSLTKRTQDEVKKKAEMWEREVSQALDLAAGYKSKAEAMEVEMSSSKSRLESFIKDLESKLSDMESRIHLLDSERQTLSDQVQQCQHDYDQEKKLVNAVKGELSEKEEVVNKLEAELSVVKEQRDLLSIRLKEERCRNSGLESQKTALQEALDSAHLKLGKAEEEAKTAVTQIDKMKMELRALYQGQLEAVVKEKLTEFQSQLDSAQAAMEQQVDRVKKAGEEKAAAQQQALVNSHVAEMRRLESIHKEETRALEKKLAEVERRCHRLESGKKEVAQKLHQVMETQWQQALSIITSEISRKGESEGARRRSESPVGQCNLTADDLRLDLRENGLGSTSSAEEAPFTKDGQLTYRVANPSIPSTGVSQASSLPQDQLVKYIQILLDKQPGRPVDSLSLSTLVQDSTVTSDVPEDGPPDFQANRWNEVITENQKDGACQTNGKSRKPPWK